MDEHNNVEIKKKKDKRSYYKWLFFFSVTTLVVSVLLVGFTVTLLKNDAFQFQSNTAGATSDQENATIEKNVTISTEVTEAVNKASDAVVGVVSYREQTDLWAQGNQKAGTGSGVIYKKADGKAYVVTNHHVIEQASSVEVVLSDGTKVPSEILGKDQLSDLAVLKIDGKNVTQTATFGSSEDLTVGEPAIAIGNPLGLEFAGSVTKGIISGLGRTIPVDLNKDGKKDWQTQVIQTDAAINPGNSGGALINIKGQVIGINSMKIAKQSVEGLGFAIPIETAKPIIKDLEENGEVSRPYIGISPVSLASIPTIQVERNLNLPDHVQHGVLVAGVKQGSPADKAGLTKLDVIVNIDDQEITSLMELRKYLYTNKEVGDTIDITYYRDGQQQTTKLQLAK